MKSTKEEISFIVGYFMKQLEEIKGALLGLCVGDALGLPVQFLSRERMKQHPVHTMVGYGTYNKPPGTWSDDSSLTFCLAESLCDGYNLENIARGFVAWMDEGYWSAEEKAFDIGGTTRASISRLKRGISPKKSADTTRDCNGNGSLMRILPLAFYLQKEEYYDLFSYVHQVSAITHGHPVSLMACGIYVVLAINLLKGFSLVEAYEKTKKSCLEFYHQEPYQQELPLFSRILISQIDTFPEEEIGSSGYVLDTLEAALWCLLRGDSYQKTVLDAVNLGVDTDTTAAVAGGLAGLYYGFEAIPKEWIDTLVSREKIFSLVERFSYSLR